MSTKSTSFGKLLPVLFGFFVMGFVDIIGVSTANAQETLGLTETTAGLIGTMMFIWFLLLSVPTSMLMNRIGRKTTVQISNVVTIVGMMIPFFAYDIVTLLISFAMLGIGNTMLQVSLNPLLTNVVKGDSLTSSLTTGQVVKAVSSFCGPLIVLFATSYFGKWQYTFPIYALVTLVAAIWLQLTPIKEEKPDAAASIGATFGLLKDMRILLLFLGIIFVVGVDVGGNTIAPKLLRAICGLETKEAGLGSSIYFACRTAGAFLGAFLLVRVNDIVYFRVNITLALAAAVMLFFAQSATTILIFVGAIGFLCSSLFAVIFSQALKARPDKKNEISGLLISAIVGGALVPPAMGYLSDLFGNPSYSAIVLIACITYLVICSFVLKKSYK